MHFLQSTEKTLNNTATKDFVETKISETKAYAEVKVSEAKFQTIIWSFAFWVTVLTTVFTYIKFLK